jgi:hypothetical protein
MYGCERRSGDMKLEEVQKMTDEEMTKKIAALCEWTYDDRDEKMFFTKDGDIVGYDWPSLDAIHEAIVSLSLYQKAAYRNVLVGMVCKGEGEEGNWDAIDASFRQRAEAFVITMEGKRL